MSNRATTFLDVGNTKAAPRSLCHCGQYGSWSRYGWRAEPAKTAIPCPTEAFPQIHFHSFSHTFLPHMSQNLHIVLNRPTSTLRPVDENPEIQQNIEQQQKHTKHYKSSHHQRQDEFLPIYNTEEKATPQRDTLSQHPNRPRSSSKYVRTTKRTIKSQPTSRAACHS